MYNRLSFLRLLFLASSLLLVSCSTKSDEPVAETSKPSTKFTQYYVKGEELFLQHCSNCHQKNGTGLGLLFPPINNSDFLVHREEVICLMKHGKKGEVIVNGKSYNKEMKGIAALSDLEIAEIATYIYNAWDKKQGIVEVKDVSRILNECPGNQ